MEQTDQEQSNRDQRTLEQLKGTVLASWGEYHQPLPGVLYHYTSADGLIGILTSRSIWLTDLR